MNVLVGCEESGTVARAFRLRGHNAWSCDLAQSRSNHRCHIVGDVLEAIAAGVPGTGARWDLLIAHPPCTYLCNSGVGRLRRRPPNPSPGVLYGLKRWQAMYAAAELFRALLECDVPRVCLENPTMHGYAYDIIGARPTQTIQPYQFGDDASKGTKLWLRNLELLIIPPESEWVAPRYVKGKPRWANQTDSGQNKLAPSATRGRDRSVTYPGIARAMAEQWG